MKGRLGTALAVGAGLAAGFLLSLCLSAAAQTPRPGLPGVPTVSLMAPTGSITVSVKNQEGSTITQMPPDAISIQTTMPGTDTLNFLGQHAGEDWEFSNLTPGMQYDVSVRVPGYEAEDQYVTLPPAVGASSRVDFFLRPANRASEMARSAGMAILAPRAQKEVQQGVKDLGAKKFDSAQKHLGKALAMAPGNPLVNYLLGASWLEANQTDKAIPYLEKAISLDPKQTRALVALGMVRYRQGDAAKAVELLKQAVDSAPDMWEAHWLLGAASLRAGNYRQASEEAETAVREGKEKADQALLVRTMALAGLGKRDEALQAIADYRKRHPDDRQAEQIQKALAEPPQAPPAPAATKPTSAKDQMAATLQAGSADAALVSAPPPQAAAFATVPAPGRSEAPPATVIDATPASPPLPSLKERWVPADVDEEVPARISGATCDLPRVLKHAGEHAEEFVANLEKFGATEEYQEAEIGRNGELKRPVTQKFSYLVTIQRVRPDIFYLQELRTPVPSAGEPLVSAGTAALALVFHPAFAGDFAWKCEGLGEWKGQPAWMLHFQQRPDRRTSGLHSFVTPHRNYRLALKGRAWVAANGNQVLHLESDLEAPQTELQLERDHFAIDYSLVRFRTQPVALWLPRNVDIFYRYRGHSYHQYSRLSNFQLFWVGTAQRIEPPKQIPRQP